MYDFLVTTCLTCHSFHACNHLLEHSKGWSIYVLQKHQTVGTRSDVGFDSKPDQAQGSVKRVLLSSHCVWLVKRFGKRVANKTISFSLLLGVYSFAYWNREPRDLHLPLRDFSLGMAAPVVDAEYLKEIEKARRDFRALIASKNCAPIMLRLAWVRPSRIETHPLDDDASCKLLYATRNRVFSFDPSIFTFVAILVIYVVMPCDDVGIPQIDLSRKHPFAQKYCLD